MSEQDLITWTSRIEGYYHGACKFDCFLGIRKLNNIYKCTFRTGILIGEFDDLEQAKKHCENFLIMSEEEKKLTVEKLKNK